MKFKIYIKFLLRDAFGLEAWYEAVSVIEFQGSINNRGGSHGHYLCDIKDKITKKWFRTNDNSDPIQIRTCDVSQYGYIVLFKRV